MNMLMPNTQGLKPFGHMVVYGLWFFGLFGFLITSSCIGQGLVGTNNLYASYPGVLWFLLLVSAAGVLFSYMFREFVEHGFGRQRKK